MCSCINFIVCEILFQTCTEESCLLLKPETPRVFVIGDIHGSYDALKQILVRANISTAQQPCHWRDGLMQTLLIQVGDLVDRGLHSLECIECLEALQKTASKAVGSHVVRLIGNHDIWWLEGNFDYTDE